MIFFRATNFETHPHKINMMLVLYLMTIRKFLEVSFHLRRSHRVPQSGLGCPSGLVRAWGGCGCLGSFLGGEFMLKPYNSWLYEFRTNSDVMRYWILIDIYFLYNSYTTYRV